MTLWDYIRALFGLKPKIMLELEENRRTFMASQLKGEGQ